MSSDPFSLPDPFASIGHIPGLDDGPRQKPRAEWRQPLSPEESEGIGHKVLGTGLSGLQYALGSLNKPGNAVRGVLAGKGPGALKNLIPFSDTMGITDEHDHTSGRELTDTVGLTDKNDKGWGAWGVGLAADIGTDPLTYTTFGAKHALTPIGEAMKGLGATKGLSREAMLQGFQDTTSGLRAAGKSAPEIAHMVDQGRRIATPEMEAAGAAANEPLGSLAKIGIPGTKISVNVGTGPIAQKVARGLDTTGDYLKYGNPIGRTIGGLFDHAVGGRGPGFMQKGYAEAGHPLEQSIEKDVRGDLGEFTKLIHPVIDTHLKGAGEEAVTRATESAAEGVGGHLHDPSVWGDVQPAGEHLRNVQQRYLDEARTGGAPLKDAADPYAAYTHRRANDIRPENLQIGGKRGPTNYAPVTSGSNMARESWTRELPGGEARIIDWVKRFAGESAEKIEPMIREDLGEDFAQLGRGPMTDELRSAFDIKANEVAKALEAKNARYKTDQLSMYDRDVAGTLQQRGAQHAKTMGATAGVMRAMGLAAEPIGEGMTSIPALMEKLGLTTTFKDGVASGAGEKMYRELAPKGAGMVEPLLQSEGLYGNQHPLMRKLAEYGVSPEKAAQILEGHTQWGKPPNELQGLAKAASSFTNAFKGAVYPPFLASHVRNAGTAELNALQTGTGIRDLWDQAKVMTGRGKQDFSGINPTWGELGPTEQATALKLAQHKGGNVFSRFTQANDVAGAAAEDFVGGAKGKFTRPTPGSDIPYAADIAKEYTLGTAKGIGKAAREIAGNPREWKRALGENLGIRGVGNVRRDTLGVVKAGRSFSQQIEDFFRGAQMNGLMRRGYTPEAAGDLMNHYQFDYDAFTPFEKNVMKPLMPFYSFMRKNIPLQAETLATRPGVIANQYKPFNQQRPDGPGYIPHYLNSGAAFPLGQEQDGTQQFVSKLGLPAEDALEKFHLGGSIGDNIRDTALDFAGQLNPLVKAPLEQLGDIQFHSQRKLSDLKPQQSVGAIGRLFGDDNPQLLSQMVANSPLARFATSADLAMDPRKSAWQKALNLLTGVKVTDVNVDAQRAIDTRNALEKILQGHPNISQYTSMYVKPQDAAKLTPEEIELMQKYAEIQRNAQAHAKQQRQQIGIQQ